MVILRCKNSIKIGDIEIIPAFEVKIKVVIWFDGGAWVA